MGVPEYAKSLQGRRYPWQVTSIDYGHRVRVWTGDLKSVRFQDCNPSTMKVTMLYTSHIDQEYKQRLATLRGC
jgi:hypothetical protein